MDNTRHSVVIQTSDFDLASEYAALRSLAPSSTGAIATFTGLVRDFGDQTSLTGMVLEHYPGMTEKAILDLMTQAANRWPIEAARVIHRVGQLGIAEQIVFVGVAAAHRREAFAACEFIMDYLKVSAPFWKKELKGDQSTWVAAKQSDQKKAHDWSIRDTDS